MMILNDHINFNRDDGNKSLNNINKYSKTEILTFSNLILEYVFNNILIINFTNEYLYLLHNLSKYDKKLLLSNYDLKYEIINCKNIFVDFNNNINNRFFGNINFVLDLKNITDFKNYKLNLNYYNTQYFMCKTDIINKFLNDDFVLLPSKFNKMNNKYLNKFNIIENLNYNETNKIKSLHIW